MKSYKMNDAPQTEEEIVYEYNNIPPKLKPYYYPDPINVYNIKGELIGYS